MFYAMNLKSFHAAYASTSFEKKTTGHFSLETPLCFGSFTPFKKFAIGITLNPAHEMGKYRDKRTKNDKEVLKEISAQKW